MNQSCSPSLFSVQRVEWVDSARVIAAIIVMYIHVPGRLAFLDSPQDSLLTSNIINYVPYGGAVPLFLILSGYFLSRSVSWKKVWKRFIWLFIPYAIWNLLIYTCYKLVNYPLPEASSLLGIGSVFIQGIALSDVPLQYPVIGPSWFLRDIMLLTLLTPIFVRFRVVLPAILLIFASVMQLNMKPDPWVTLSVGTCLLYMLGVVLGQFKLEVIRNFFTPATSVALVLGVVVGFGIAIKNSLMSGEGFLYHEWELSLVGYVFGAMLIVQCGILIENYFPIFSQRLATLAPSCFLVFMLHRPLFNILAMLLPESVTESYWALLIPVPVFFFIVGGFEIMKRFTPVLLPYLAHERRPGGGK